MNKIIAIESLLAFQHIFFPDIIIASATVDIYQILRDVFSLSSLVPLKVDVYIVYLQSKFKQCSIYWQNNPLTYSWIELIQFA